MDGHKRICSSGVQTFFTIRQHLALENELDEFLDAVSEAGLIFQKGVSAFLTRQDDQFTDKVAQLGELELERRGDDLRGQI